MVTCTKRAEKGSLLNLLDMDCTTIWRHSNGQYEFVLLSIMSLGRIQGFGSVQSFLLHTKVNRGINLGVNPVIIE